MSTGSKIRIVYMHPNLGNHRVVGPSTKEYYGYFGGSSPQRTVEFDVFEADAKARPDLFIPKKVQKELLKAQKKAIEAQLAEDEDQTDEENEPEITILTPAYSDESTIDLPKDEQLSNLDFPQGITSRQIIALSDIGIDTVADFQDYLKEGNDLRDIPGIADASAVKLSKMVRDYLAGA